MAAVFGDEYTNAFTDGERVSPAHSGGEVHVISDYYEASSLAADSTITMGGCKLPAGARIVYARMAWDALSTSRTLALSDGSADVIAATSASSAGSAEMDIDYLGTEVAAENFPVVTLAGGTGTGKIEVVILYTFH